MTYIDADHYGARIEARVSGKLRDSAIGQVIETDDHFLLPLAVFDYAVVARPPYTDPEFVPGMVVRNADDRSDYRRWSYYGDPAWPFWWVNRDDPAMPERYVRGDLPDRLAVAYDPRQDAP